MDHTQVAGGHAAGRAGSFGLAALRRVDSAGVLVVLALGLAAIIAATRWGAGVSPDSVEYLAAARSIQQGTGVTTPAGDGSPVPMTLWPPLFPAALALLGAAGTDLHVVGRWLNVVLFGANLVLAALLLHRSARAPAWMGWLAAAGMLIFTDLITVHGWIWSEPLFIFLGLSSLTLLLEHLRTSDRAAWWGAAVFAAAAFTTRFVGAAFVATGAVSILLLNASSSWKARLRDSIAFGLVGGAPMAAWLVRNRLVAGSLTDRTFAFYPLTAAHARQALDTASSWIWPMGVGTDAADWLMLGLALAGAALVLAMVLLPSTAVPEASRPAVRAGRVLSLFAAFYVLVLLFSKSAVDPDFPFDSRILAPLHLALWLSVLCMAAALRSWPSVSAARAARLAPFMAGAVVIVVFALQLAQSVHWVERAYVRGLGYASKSWQESSLLAYLQGLPPGTPIYSNGPDVILDRTERPAFKLPGRPRADSPRSQELFAARLEAMHDVLGPDGGLIVYFDGITWRNLVDGDELSRHMPLQVLFHSDQGTIYQVEAY